MRLCDSSRGADHCWGWESDMIIKRHQGLRAAVFLMLEAQLGLELVVVSLELTKLLSKILSKTPASQSRERK